MQIHLQSPDLQKAKAFAEGQTMAIFESEHLWEKHTLFFPEEDGYLQCLEKAKQILNTNKLIVTERFVIIEATDLPEYLLPILSRCINFVHGGNKVIGSLDKIIFVPDWYTDSLKTFQIQLTATYVPLKLNTMTFWEKFKLNTFILISTYKGDESFEKAYMKTFQQLSGVTESTKASLS